mmetsp:Transcript_27518/g.75127  ORF Transcript_27518/g.75127 Transcript_27518/m.75127 type:complete len:269 (-) Transcript_27518:908-1714(-)
MKIEMEMEMEANIGTVRYDARFGLRFTVHRLQLFCTPGFPKVLLFLRSQNPIRSRVVRRQASPCGSTASRRWIIEERRLCACVPPRTFHRVFRLPHVRLRSSSSLPLRSPGAINRQHGTVGKFVEQRGVASQPALGFGHVFGSHAFQKRRLLLDPHRSYRFGFRRRPRKTSPRKGGQSLESGGEQNVAVGRSREVGFVVSSVHVGDDGGSCRGGFCHAGGTGEVQIGGWEPVEIGKDQAEFGPLLDSVVQDAARHGWDPGGVRLRQRR